jgi:hypothetical protein
VEEKVTLGEEHGSTHDLNRCLVALGLSRSTRHYRRQMYDHRRARDEALKEQIVSAIEEHPAYDYRRIWLERTERSAERIDLKRLRRVLKSFELG